jgi:Protein of unknwon function (DUF3310)
MSAKCINCINRNIISIPKPYPCNLCREIMGSSYDDYFKPLFGASKEAVIENPMFNAEQNPMAIRFDQNKIDQKITNSLNTQVGGSHYKNLAIQPVEYAFKNKLGYIEGAIVKYITRYEVKGGKEDLEKIKHFCDLLIELRYGNEK